MKSALATLKPDAVSINTWPDTHADFAKRAFKAGAHVFLEKPIATTVKEARSVIAAARKAKRKLVIGYILRVHPSWIKFIELGQDTREAAGHADEPQPAILGRQLGHAQEADGIRSARSSTAASTTSMSCARSRAPSRRASMPSACRLTEEIAEGMYNYGQLQVEFDDGSVGWYEAGWGPMMSETAYFVKDMIGPKGSVSIVMGDETGASQSHDSHTKTNALRLHHGALNGDGALAKPDEIFRMADEPGHQELCDREQRMFLDAIINDLDLTDHLDDAINSLRIALAADKSVRTGRAVSL